MHSSAARLAIGLACVVLGCHVGACTSEREGLPDDELGNLVVSPEEALPEVDVDKAAGSPAATSALLRLPHAWVGESIGAHKVAGKMSMKVLEGQDTVEELDETLVMSFDGEGRYRAELNNSKEYGRHVVFDGSTLYLRPRFGRYHGRAPNDESEADSIRNELFASATEYLEVASKQLELSDKGAATQEGRAVRKLQLQLAPKERKVEEETLPQRLWRNDAEVKALGGELLLDVETGVPLALSFETTIAFERDKRRFEMSISAERRIHAVGHSERVEAPSEEEVVRIPIRRRELDEREQLLKSIAPPAPSAPTPSGSGAP